MSFRDILKTQRSIKKTGSVRLSNRHAIIVIILPSIGWEKLHDELRSCFISFWNFPAQFSLCSDQPSPIFESLNVRTQSVCWKPPWVLIITSSSLQFLRATVFSSCFHTANLQPFTSPCPATEISFWLSVRTGNIFPWHPLCSPEMFSSRRTEVAGTDRRWESRFFPLREQWSTRSVWLSDGYSASCPHVLALPWHDYFQEWVKSQSE